MWQPDAPISPRHFLKKIFKNCLKKYLLTSLSRRCHSIWARFSCLGWLTNDFIRLLCIKGSTIRGVFLAKEMANHFLFSQCFYNFFFEFYRNVTKVDRNMQKGERKKCFSFIFPLDFYQPLSNQDSSLCLLLSIKRGIGRT